jgi:basic membrane protein A
MRKQRFGLLATITTAALVLAACNGSGSSPSASTAATTSGAASASASASESTGATSDLKIGLVTDVGTLDDKNFNQFSWEGAKAGAEAIGAPEPQSVVTTASAD